MKRISGLWLCLPIILRAASGVALIGQVSPIAITGDIRFPDAAASAIIDNMHIPATPGAPFSSKSIATLTQVRREGTKRFGFFSLVARSVSGRLYFENRRPFPTAERSIPRSYFIIIDPGEHTRTVCYVATKTCRINAFVHVVDAESDTREEVPPASKTTAIDLGASAIESVTVLGTRETTVIAAGAYGNRQQIVTTKEVWRSPALDISLSTTRTDPRWGAQTREFTEISLREPDAEYFVIPPDYKLLDNRPPAKQ